jgi:hypothetical protein
MQVYRAVVEYAYTVGGREYRSARLALGPELAGAEADAQAQAARYVVGGEVIVHYDPAAPASAVLDTTVRSAWPTLAVGVALAALACFLAGLFG